MLTSTSESLVNKLRIDVGEDLRFVAQYDADDIEPLYVREDVEEHQLRGDYETLHSYALSDHEDSELKQSFDAGELEASLLAFEDLIGTNFIGEEYTGHVTILEADVDLELQSYLRRFDVITTTVRRFESIRFEHQPARQACPRCGSPRTISTPEAGPGAPHYCLTCDTSFS